MLFGLVEYWVIVSVMEVASIGLRWKRSGNGEWPEIEVRMHVFIGLTKHPSGAPMVANQLQRNCKSTSGMQQRRRLHSKEMCDASKTIITRITLEEASCGSFA